MNTLARWGAAGQLVGGAARARDQFAAAIGALAAQYRVGTVRAKRALERADAGFSGFGRQVSVAAFTTGSEFEHGDLPLD